MLVWQEGSDGGVPACGVLKHASKLLGIIPSQSCPQVVNIHQNIDDSHLSCQCLSETSWEAAWQSLKGSIVLPLFFRRERREGGEKERAGCMSTDWKQRKNMALFLLWQVHDDIPWEQLIILPSEIAWQYQTLLWLDLKENRVFDDAFGDWWFWGASGP